MPRILRVFFTGLAFFGFAVGSVFLLIPLSLLLTLVPGSRATRKRRATLLVNRAMKIFAWWMRCMGLLTWDPVPPLPVEGPCVIVANHPTLVDVVLLLGALPDVTTTMIGAHYFDLWLMRPFLKRTDHIPTGGTREGQTGVDRMVDRLKRGVRVLAFPEGTRSLERTLHRFRRGACEAAIRAGVPVVAIFVSVDRPLLMKGVPWHHVPSARGRYAFEILETLPSEGADPKELNRRLQDLFNRRFQEHLKIRDAEATEPSRTSNRSV